jgi:hypothetical protein
MGWPRGEGLGPWSFLLLRSQVRILPVPFPVGSVHTKQKSSGFKWAPQQVDGGIGVS